ncbi:MAG TPA: hypothetical protein EYP35_10440 [Desulfobacterales bacterium]|nr:hypothetical protein [Desulfobacterales bacterium]HIP39152.1 hypothetical protein [Desulfocapsa sulfexigens]
MEPLTIFGSTVGLIGAIHLLSVTVERFGQGRYNRNSKQAQREDWYCFFQPSDLNGSNSEQNENGKTQPSISSEAEQLEQRRRQQANRPRLQA